MKTNSLSSEDLRGVFAVPPLARRRDPARSLDLAQNDLIVRHIISGGITRLIYGGNAFLYHNTLAEFEELLEWLAGFSDQLWGIPRIGPSYGPAMGQAKLLPKAQFPCVMALPCHDPSRGAYLEALLSRVDRKFVISGIGERPAVVHLRDWKLPGFTTGSGCIAPRLSQMLFEASTRPNFDEAEALRSEFISLEDLRDEWGPAKVLHSAIELAGIAQTGESPPFVSGLSVEECSRLETIV